MFGKNEQNKNVFFGENQKKFLTYRHRQYIKRTFKTLLTHRDYIIENKQFSKLIKIFRFWRNLSKNQKFKKKCSKQNLLRKFWKKFKIFKIAANFEILNKLTKNSQIQKNQTKFNKKIKNWSRHINRVSKI